MIVIRKCRSFFKILEREKNWWWDKYKWRKLFQPKQTKKRFDGKILVLMPHSDDEWIGCSSLLINNSNVVVLNMDMCGGDTKEVHKLRFEEAVKASKKYGYSLENIMGDKTEALLKILKEYVPKYVLLPFYLDWHEEHVEVMNIFLNSAQRMPLEEIPEVVMYQVSLPLPYKMIDLCYPMTKKEWKRKWRELCKIYRSQVFLPVKRFAYNEYINGAVCGAYACEVFSVKSFEVWKREFQKYKLTKNERDFCRKNIQEIGKIRKWIEERMSNV